MAAGAPASKHAALPRYSDNCERLLHLRSLVYFSTELRCDRAIPLVHNQLVSRKDFGFLPTLPYVGCLSSWRVPCDTTCIGKMTKRDRSASAKNIDNWSAERSVCECNGAVSICEMDDEPEQVFHDRDALFCLFTSTLRKWQHNKRF